MRVVATMLGTLVLLCAAATAPAMLLRGGGENIAAGATRKGRTPVIEDDTMQAGGNDIIKSVTFESRPVAVAGGYEVALVTITGDGPFLPPELAALMPPEEGEHLHFQHIEPLAAERGDPSSGDAHAPTVKSPDAPLIPPDLAARLPPADKKGSNTTNITSTTTTKNNVKHKKIKKPKLERFINLINKNIELVKYLEDERNGTGAWPGRLGGRGGRREDDDDTMPLGMGLLLRAHNILDAKQLDLAPAKGTRINKMRDRGRLCSRQVLRPEGPKYNEEGKIVKKENGSFSQTRAPDLLLPQCCNCCQKSVLGCE